MNVPLNWLSEYVTLPDSTEELTDRLTMIGHMLDKKFESNGEPVIDLELRGNRADLFGLLGIARDVSAAWDVSLTFPEISRLPSFDKKSKLITVEASDLVPRFTGLTISVSVGPSPDWMKERLAAYGMASINNVVDITNYVMIETGIPLHAFDVHSLKGNRLIIRRAKKHEQMMTFMGEKINLTPDDIALCDEEGPQAITLVGSKSSGTTNETTTILLEGAVYNQASVRRTSRRLGIRTEAGTRLEKHLDPNEVTFALSRALYLLQKHASGKVQSTLADHYPTAKKPLSIDLPVIEVQRISGITLPSKHQKTILERLGCTVTEGKGILHIIAPTFRTDISEEADFVEEITRIAGYETIPTLTLDGELPPEQTSTRIKQENLFRTTLVNLQQNEVITSSFIQNTFLNTYVSQGEFPSAISLKNPPDPAIATLRPSLFPNLVEYAKRSFHQRAERVSIFEMGNIYWNTHVKKSEQYHEERRLGIVVGGFIDTKSYGKKPRELTFFDLKGILESLGEILGIPFIFSAVAGIGHPTLDHNQQIQITIRQKDISIQVGFAGLIDPKIQKDVGIERTLYGAELSLDLLHTIPFGSTKPYKIAPTYPPIIEDLSVVVSPDTNTERIINTISSIDSLISEVRLLDAYENKQTFRITYQDASRNLSNEEIKPIREKIIAVLESELRISLVK